VLMNIALLENNSGNAKAGKAPAVEAINLLRQQGAEETELGAMTHGVLGLIYGRTQEPLLAREHMLRSLAIREKTLDPNDESIASSHHNLGLHFVQTGMPATALTHYLKSIEIKTRIYGEKHPRVFNTVEPYGMTLREVGRIAESDAVLSQLYADQVEVNGPNGERVASTASAWADTLLDLGRFAEACQRYAEAVRITSTPPLAQRSMRYSGYEQRLGLCLEETGDARAAEAAYRNALSVRSRVLGADDPVVANTKHALGRLLLRQGKLDDAEQLLNDALSVRQKREPATNNATTEDVANARIDLIELALRRAGYAPRTLGEFKPQVLPAAQEALAAAQARFSTISLSAKASTPSRAGYLLLEARLAEAAGNLNEAANAHRRRIDVLQAAYGAAHPRVAAAGIHLARVLVQSRDPAARAEALALALRAEPIFAGSLGVSAKGYHADSYLHAHLRALLTELRATAR
jgi:tetratricopeptide (TPR) repeat protein